MATPARALAKCVMRWIYEQASAILQMLKQFLMGLISYIDAQIAILKAWLAQWDLLARAEEYIWNLVMQGVEEVREALMTTPDGPLAEFCPSFYRSFMDPALAIFNSLVESVTIFRNRFHDMISYMDEVENLIAYWEQIKVDLMAAIEILDDAIYLSLMNSADQVP